MAESLQKYFPKQYQSNTGNAILKLCHLKQLEDILPLTADANDDAVGVAIFESKHYPELSIVMGYDLTENKYWTQLASVNFGDPLDGKFKMHKSFSMAENFVNAFISYDFIAWAC